MLLDIEHSRTELVKINLRESPTGSKSNAAYIERYLPALLEGRLVSPRRNMDLDSATGEVVGKIFRHNPGNPEERSVLALTILRRCPYLAARYQALGVVSSEFEKWNKQRRETATFGPIVQDLISISDQTQEVKLRTALFVHAASMGATLGIDYFPLLSTSLTTETDMEAFAKKFNALFGYLQRGPYTEDERQMRVKASLNEVKSIIEQTDPSTAANLIFRILNQYDHNGIRDVVFRQAPLDLMTLRKLCQQAPEDQKEKVVRSCRNELLSLVENTWNYDTTSPQASRQALVDFFFRDITDSKDAD